MSETLKVCPRCRGRRELYKIMGSCYSLTNTGGQLVKCPCCLGEGKIKTLEEAVKDIDKKVSSKREYKKDKSK